jgi:hypothetical protein
VEITRDAPVQHVIDGPGQLMGHDRQRLALAVCVLYAGERGVARRMVAEAQHRRGGAGPREIRLPDLRAGGALPLPRRCLGTRDQAAVGHKLVHAGEALEGMDFIEQPQAQHRTDPRAGASQVERVGLVRLGRGADRQLHVTEPVVVVPHQRQIACDALLPRGSGTPRGHAVAVGLRGQLFPDRGPVVLTGGVLDLGESLGACAPEVDPAPEEITGRAHGGWIDIGLREHPTAQQHGNFL